MQAQKECGYYCEYFFIDALDTEYCLRLQSRGWKIKVVEDSLLNHSLGAMIDKNIPLIKKRIYVTEYTPERLYYIARNHSIIISHYKNVFPNTCKIQRKFLFYLFIKIFIYEKNIYAKFKMILRGFLDARREIASHKKNFLFWADSKCAQVNPYAM
jgi:rhamnosyltransferase